MFTKILVPVDLGEPTMAERALRAILEYTRVAETQVRLLHVHQLVPQMVTEYLPPTFEVEATDESEAKLKAFIERMGLPMDRTTTVVRVGGVYHEVLEEAQSFGADLIVVGSHRPSMATYLIGSNAARIVRYAPCSVLVVRD
jgi:nucleotide-binding universal stress UspA family protein